MGLCERNMNVLISLYHHKDQTRFSVPDCVLDCVWKLKVASQSVFYILAKWLWWLLFFSPVFSLRACTVVWWSSLNTVVRGRNPWPLTPLQSLQHVRAKSIPSVPPIPLWSKPGRQKERWRTIGLAVCCSETISVKQPVWTLPALFFFTFPEWLLACKHGRLQSKNTVHSVFLTRNGRCHLQNKNFYKGQSFVMVGEFSWLWRKRSGVRILSDKVFMEVFWRDVQVKKTSDFNIRAQCFEYLFLKPQLHESLQQLR